MANCSHDRQKIKNKQSLIQQLREVAEKETAWLEKNCPLYTQKRSQLESLIKERDLIRGEVTLEEQKLIKHVVLNESRLSGMWDLAEEINEEEQRFDQIISSKKR